MNTFLGLSDAMETTRVAPKRFKLLPKGEIKYTVDSEDGKFVLNDINIDQIIDAFNKRGKDIVIDYDHSTLNADSTNVGNAPAGGWCRLSKGEDGIYADVNSWTKKAQKMLENGEYRYFSPVVEFDDENGNEPIGIHSIALTNHPAIHGCPHLVAANDTNKIGNTKMIDDDLKNAINQVLKENELQADIDEAVGVNENSIDENTITLEPSIKDYKEVIKDLKSIIDNAQAEMSTMLDKLSNRKNVTNEEQIEITAFTDGLFKNDVQVFGNVKAMNDSITIDKTNVAQIKELEKTIDDININYKKDKIAFSDIKKEFYAKNDSNIKLFNSLKGVLGLSVQDSKNKIKSVLEDKLKAFADMENKKKEFLALNDCKSFSDVIKKVKEKDNTISTLEQKIEVEKVLHKALNDGKIVHSEIEKSRKFAMRDLEAFNDFVLNKPNFFKMNNDVDVTALNDFADIDKPIPQEYQEVAKATGMDARELMEYKPPSQR